MIRVLPELDDQAILDLFHDQVRHGWSADDIDWRLPLELPPALWDPVSACVAPLLRLKQSIWLGSTHVLHLFFQAKETSSQLYMAAFQLDQALHVLTLSQLLSRLGGRPGDLPHDTGASGTGDAIAALAQPAERMPWLWGVLCAGAISEQLLTSLAALGSANDLTAQIFRRLLDDEARHRRFLVAYLSRALPECSDPRDTLLSMHEQWFQRLYATWMAAAPATASLGISLSERLAVASGFAERLLDSLCPAVGVQAAHDDPSVG